MLMEQVIGMRKPLSSIHVRRLPESVRTRGLFGLRCPLVSTRGSMGVSRYEKQVDCRCGNGQLLVEFVENDHPYGNWWERTSVLKPCPVCGSSKVPKPTKKQQE